jgi:hypothetical protein
VDIAEGSGWSAMHGGMHQRFGRCKCVYLCLAVYVAYVPNVTSIAWTILLSWCSYGLDYVVLLWFALWDFLSLSVCGPLYVVSCYLQRTLPLPALHA